MPPHAPAAGPASPSRCARTPGADRRLPSLALGAFSTGLAAMVLAVLQPASGHLLRYLLVYLLALVASLLVAFVLHRRSVRVSGSELLDRVRAECVRLGALASDREQLAAAPRSHRHVGDGPPPPAALESNGASVAWAPRMRQPVAALGAST